MKNKETWFTLLMLSIVISIFGYEFKLLQTQILVKQIISEDIDYTTFREFQITEAALKNTEAKILHIIKKNPVLQDMTYMDNIGYLTFCMMVSDFNLIKYSPVDEQTFLRGIGRVVMTEQFQELYDYYNAIVSDLEYFPVPKMDGADVTYTDSWLYPRSYGGDRKHEGTDLMSSNNLRGYFPVISMTDGTVEKIGWLEQGGYRIGIRSESGGYFYYAHLYSYAPELKQGDTVIAGQLLGFMGDSGYGSEGTIGQFDVHLHMGFYVNSESGEMSVNPYWLLRILENYRTKYDYQ